MSVSTPKAVRLGSVQNPEPHQRLRESRLRRCQCCTKPASLFECRRCWVSLLKLSRTCPGNCEVGIGTVCAEVPVVSTVLAWGGLHILPYTCSTKRVSAGSWHPMLQSASDLGLLGSYSLPGGAQTCKSGVPCHCFPMRPGPHQQQ